MYLRGVGRRFTQIISYFLVMNSKRCIKTTSTSASRSLKGWDTKHTTVNWPITEERTKNPKVMAVRDFLVSSTIWVVFMEGGSF